MLLSELGNRIRAQREKRGLKQQDIANALDVSPQAVSKWERGENAPDITVLKPLALLLGVTTDWLLSVYDAPRDEFDAAVLSSNIHGAHKKSLSMTAREFALWANGVFYQLTEITLRHEGIPVKYMGDQYLCFFAGPRRVERALHAAFQARAAIAEDLKIGLSRGEIYLGSVGHPDYCRPDIMGQIVNIAFLTAAWADAHTESGVAATSAIVEELTEIEDLRGETRVGRKNEVSFRGVAQRVALYEIRRGTRSRKPEEKP
jgi:transcriptional regulator with XRE-family HTH domain